QPGRHPVGDAFRPVLTFDIAWSTTLRTQPLQHLDDIHGRDRADTGDRQALTGIFIEDRQTFQPPTIGGLLVHKVIAPDMLRRGGPCWGGCALAHRAPFLCGLEHLESLVLPDAADRLAMHPPLFRLQQVRDLAISKAWILLRE